MDKNISFTLKVWRQKYPKVKGAFETYQMKDIPGDTSFLEMLDILNEQLISEGKEPVVFDHDCREGICGMCSLYINGHPHLALQPALLLAKFICVVSTTAIPSLLNRGALPVSRLSRT